jgi:Carboxypeptidase regulatory-like domain/TonB-dependent Receptor Plug Domain
MKALLSSIFTLVVCLSVLSSSGLAQGSDTSLTGIVTDASHAAIASAKVTARNKSTNFIQEVRTDSLGSYSFLSLPIGTYNVMVEQAGFSTLTEEVTLETAQKARRDFEMQVGQTQQTVTVEDAAQNLSTQDASLGAVINNRTVADTPLYLRNWDDLLRLVPGVQSNRYTDQSGATSAGRTGAFNVHGVHSLQNDFILDGIDNNTFSENVQELSTQSSRPSVDTIQEFKVITNPYSAEFGRSPGAAVVVTTKGGSNQIHGVAYEYLRNNYFDANDFFSNRSKLVKPKNNQNQFGGSIGAPILRDKLFGFFNYEGTRISRGVLRISTVPLANERIGDFSPAAAAANGIPAYPTIYDPSTGQPFANNQIPQNEIDPFATKIMGLFPAANLPGQLNNYVRNALLTDDADSYDGRVDWVPDTSNSVFVRYSNSKRNRFIPGNYGGIGDGTSTSAFGRQVLKGQSAVVGWTHVFSPTLVNELRIGFSRNFSFATQDPFGQNQVDEFVPGVPENPAVAGGISQITLTNFTFIGSPDFLPKQQVPQQFQWVDNVSKTIGKHSLKFGVDLRAPMRNIYQDEPGTRGSLTFDKIFTCQRDPVTHQCTGNSGLTYADFLLGDVRGSQLTNVHFVDQRLWMLSGFFEDDFKLRRNLTLNLGLRYDFSTPALEGGNQMANFDPAANGGAGGLVFAKDGSLEDRALVQINKRNFAPRIGVSYALNQKTVLHGGYGIYYMLFERFGSEDQLALNAPFLVNNVQSAASTAPAPLFLLRDGFPANSLDPNQPGLLGNVRIRAVDPSTPTPYVQQWSLGFQRELPWSLVGELNYVGTRSLHLDVLTDRNQPFFDDTGKVGATRPFPTLGYIEYQLPVGLGKYNGLEASLERRFRDGLSLRFAYTYSRSIDNTPQELENNSGSAPNGRNYSAWFGPSDFDTPHRLIASYVYELPFGRNRQFLKTGVLSYIVGGFKTSGVYTFASGRPFTVSAGGTIASSLDAFGAVAATPNQIRTPVVVGNVRCWYFVAKNNACTALEPSLSDAYQLQSPGFLGNVGRNTLRGPHTNVFDFALMRDFPIHEQIGLQFRWEVFNLTNTAQFGQPSNNFSSSSAGQITSLAGDPRVMQFALRLAF